jgi:Transposase and inactivated derivatives
MSTLDIEELEVESEEKVDDHYLIYCQLKNDTCACPTCKENSSYVHAYYDRVVQDLPINGKSVYLKIKCRKFLCKNKECPQKLFTQKTQFVRPQSKKTKRLEKVIRKVVTNTSLIEASDTLKQIGIQASKSSIAELLKKNRGLYQ